MKNVSKESLVAILILLLAILILLPEEGFAPPLDKPKPPIPSPEQRSQDFIRLLKLNIERIRPTPITTNSDVEVIWSITNRSNMDIRVKVGLFLNGEFKEQTSVLFINPNASSRRRITFISPEREGNYILELKAFDYQVNIPSATERDVLIKARSDISILKPTAAVDERPIRSETITVTLQNNLTGSVSNRGDLKRELQVGNCGMTLTGRGFLSFRLSKTEILSELLRKGHRCSQFEIVGATLEIEEFQMLSFVPGTYTPPFTTGVVDHQGVLPRSCSDPEISWWHSRISNILIDYLIGYDTFSASIYHAPMVSNIRSFQSACKVHRFANLEAYVRNQMELGKNNIQFRLRFADEHVEGDAAWTFVYSIFFRNPKLTFIVFPTY
jgi:hypothetical protein